MGKSVAVGDLLKHAVIRGGLEASALLHWLGVARSAGGRGAIFTLHHVRPFEPRAFQPNRHLEITPSYLEQVIVTLKDEGYDFAALDALPALLAGNGSQRFAAFTLDDSNRNNAEFALPIFRRHNVPFTVFVCRGLSERTHSMWWETVAALLSTVDGIRFDFGKGMERIGLAGRGERQRAFDRFAAYVHLSDEALAVGRIDAIARSHGLEPLHIVRSLIMDAKDLALLAAEPLASLGAHTVSHRALSRLDDRQAVLEMAASADYVAAMTGARPKTIAYPYGTKDAVSPRDGRLAAELGFTVGLTTQPGTIMPEMASAMTMLPRLSLNGYHQVPRYASALASGIPTRLRGSRS